ncbi:MAG: hypothetical protein C5B58_06735 [Acidobacteria bacterium]|nr:MAG: hypothetical protein C5B58_06735 [Acidobacteriota bacterium]
MSRINASGGKYATLFFGCVIFHAIGTWALPLIDRDEPRFAEASREMIERGDYVVPYFNNHLRLDKPPLAYWAQVASYRIFGESDFSARFPSGIAAALTALVIFAWGRRFDGTGVGWRAAIIFTLSLQLFLHAKAAVADMWLVLFMTLAHWSGYELLVVSTRTAAHQMPARLGPVAPCHKTRWWLTFYLSLALGFLAKGPIAWIPLLTVAAIIILARNLQLARPFKFALGIPVVLVVVALWGIPALVQTHGEFFAVGIGRHVIGRSFKTMEGHGAGSLVMYLLLLPFYFVTVFPSFFPWSIKLPWLTTKLWRRRDNIDNYLLAGIAIVFIIFTLVSTKLPHYTLPAFPLLALLLARHWRSAGLETAGSGILPNISTAPSSVRQDAKHYDPETGARRLDHRRSWFGTIAITVACVWIAIALVVPSLVTPFFFPAYQLFQESRAQLQPNMQFATVGFEEPSLVWYFRARVRGFLTPLNKKSAVEFMLKPGARFIVMQTPLTGTLFPNPPPNWKFFSTRGLNIAKGKRVELTLVLKPQ